MILGRIDTRKIVLAPALIGLGFGAMVLAVVAGGSYSAVLAGGCGGRSRQVRTRCTSRT
jgi:hypothetical protein